MQHIIQIAAAPYVDRDFDPPRQEHHLYGLDANGALYIFNAESCQWEQLDAAPAVLNPPRLAPPPFIGPSGFEYFARVLFRLGNNIQQPPPYTKRKSWKDTTEDEALLTQWYGAGFDTLWRLWFGHDYIDRMPPEERNALGGDFKYTSW